MDAKQLARADEKLRLFNRLSEIMVEEQAVQGTFESTPHFSTLEQASRALGRDLSVAALKRAAAEVATTCEPAAACPACGRRQPVQTRQRTVHSLDGPVELLEPEAHCPACRRDFFPSA
jgi:hypothetical protein